MSDDSQTIVRLDPDSTEVVVKTINELYTELAHLSSEFRNGRLTEEMRSCLCSLMEHRLDRINKTLGYYGALGKEMERRSEELRTANRLVRELRAQLGSSKPLDGFGEQLEFLFWEIHRFWGQHGFQHVSDVTFGRWGNVHVKYGFVLDHAPRDYSDTPVSDRRSHAEWLKGMTDAGYIIVRDGGGRDHALLDCDHNRRLLIDLVTKRYPSVHIYKWENLPFYKCPEHPNGSYIFGLEVTIHDVKDIPNKKEPPGPDQEAGAPDTPGGE